jgi:hypothetical protein
MTATTPGAPTRDDLKVYGGSGAQPWWSRGVGGRRRSWFDNPADIASGAMTVPSLRYEKRLQPVDRNDR